MHVFFLKPPQGGAPTIVINGGTTPYKWPYKGVTVFFFTPISGGYNLIYNL